MKKMKSIIRGLAGLFSVLVLLSSAGIMPPVQANAAMAITRDDGIWLWPLPAGTTYTTQDWAGCKPGKCQFANYGCTETHGCDAASHAEHKSGHSGMDLGVNSGTPVLAMADGRVVHTTGDGERGITVVLEHVCGDGYSYFSYYQHLSAALVSLGQYVTAGQHIANSGNTGTSLGAHLHFSIGFGDSLPEGTYIDTNHLFAIENCGWLLDNSRRTGLILVNPSSKNTLPILDIFTNSQNLSKHKGSVRYTTDPNQVNIGMNGPVISSQSPWYYSATPTVVITFGVSGPQVQWLQQALNVILETNLECDGSFGLVTNDRLVTYQNLYGLTPDSSCGPATLASILEQLYIRGYMSDGSIHTHEFTKYVSNGDETHTAKCNVCEYANPEETGVACSGGTATSTTQATCKYCGEKYGDVLEEDVVTLLYSELNWQVGKEGTFKVYVNGVQVDRTKMTWSSSNPSVATCVNGKLVGKSAGTTTISCTKENGTIATCKVTVVGKDEVTLLYSELKNWQVGKEGTFKVYVNGVQVDRTKMTWSSSNPSVATCVNGKLVGKSAGTTTISCTKANGTTATCKVTVVGKDEVTLLYSELNNWKVGKEGAFKVYVNGVQADRTKMTWSSSNPSVATCVNGKLVGKSAGTTTISCTKTNGTTATCKVTVVGKDEVTLLYSELNNWIVGKEGTFRVYVNGVQADRTTMTWNSSNPSVATCVNGKLVGKSAGTTTITCTKENGTVANCKVTVVD